MSKSLVAALLAACTAFGFSSAALADTSNTDEVKSTALVETSLIPIRILGVATALAGGIPINVLKKTADNMNAYTDSVATEIKEYEGLSPLVPLSLPGQILSLTGSCANGVIDGGTNAMKGWDKPFSAESFGLE